jgi:hypothetical protein
MNIVADPGYSALLSPRNEKKFGSGINIRYHTVYTRVKQQFFGLSSLLRSRDPVPFCPGSGTEKSGSGINTPGSTSPNMKKVQNSSLRLLKGFQAHK